MFGYTISEQDPKAVVSLEGDLDIEASEIVEQEIAGKLMSYVDVEIDFSGIQFVDSTGIGLLISMIQQAHGNGTSVVVTRLNEEVQRIFSLLQLPLIVGDGVFADL